MRTPLLLASAMLALALSSFATAQIAFTDQSARAETSGFVSGPLSFDSWNHGTTLPGVSDNSVFDSDARAAGSTASAGALTDVDFLTLTATNVDVMFRIQTAIQGTAIDNYNSTARAAGQVLQNFTLTGNVNYWLDVTINNDALLSGSFTVYGNSPFSVGAGAGLGLHSLSGTMVAGDYLLDFNNAVLASVGSGSYSGNGDMIVHLKMDAVPEPSTMALATLGAAALVRRRRSK